jgi:hypothetical protein
MYVDAAKQAAANAEQRERQRRETAGHYASVLSRTAAALDQSARLAEQHAQRQSEAGQERAAAEERRAASRARDSSMRASVQAEWWLQLSGGQTR